MYSFLLFFLPETSFSLTGALTADWEAASNLWCGTPSGLRPLVDAHSSSSTSSFNRKSLASVRRRSFIGRTTLSEPLNTSVTSPNGHWLLGVCSTVRQLPVRRTMTSTWKKYRPVVRMHILMGVPRNIEI